MLQNFLPFFKQSHLEFARRYHLHSMQLLIMTEEKKSEV